MATQSNQQSTSQVWHLVGVQENVRTFTQSSSLEPRSLSGEERFSLLFALNTFFQFPSKEPGSTQGYFEDYLLTT